MENDCDETTKLLRNRTRRDSVCSRLSAEGVKAFEEPIFGGRLVKTSTQVEALAATWGGRVSLPDSRRLRRVHSWSGDPQDDGSSEIRILRERLVRTQTRPRPGALRFLSRRQRMTLASLALVDFMSFCSMSVMAPFFPKEAFLKGLSDTMCGMVFSFYAVVMFLTSPLFGKILPSVGTKFLFISGMFITGTCNVIFGTLALIEDSTTFVVLCFIVRGLEALGASAYSTASYVFVVNAFPDSVGSVLGILETFVGLGMSVGPAIGGLLYTIGGFGLPFYTLGVIMVVTVPINFFLLTDCEEYAIGSKSLSMLGLFKIPSIIITGLVIVIVSNTWAFLDPTLEPHLRQFNLTTEQIGLIFLLFSSLYGIFSPIWGWVADRVHNHWCMMVWGLFLSTLGLLLLGPCPFIPGLPRDIWLDLVALSILGVSVALTLLPTFQGVLASSIYEGGCPEALATYSAVAGVWSCCYSLGEVLGPALGGALSQTYGFPVCATLCAAACFTMGVITLTFFSLRESTKWEQMSESEVHSIPYTDSTWNSNFCRTRSAPETRAENSPLLTPCSYHNNVKYGSAYGANSPKRFCFIHNKNNKSGSASIGDALVYFLKFQYVTDIYIKIRKSRRQNVQYQNGLYQNYLDEQCSKKTEYAKDVYLNNNVNHRESENKYCNYLENAIFGSPEVIENIHTDHLYLKKNHKGLVPALLSCDEEKKTSREIIRHNLEKVQFYEQNQMCNTIESIFDGCECREGVTFVRGTVTVSSTGACEV
ncbi:hypothetical protein ACJJTC_007821 [Scirpophaga incertulas]